MENKWSEISVFNDSGKIRLRWSYEKKRFSLILFLWNRENLKLAKNIVREIEFDFSEGFFDASLEKYKRLKKEAVLKIKVKPTKNVVGKNPLAYQPIEQKEITPASIDYITLFPKWAKEICNMDCEKNCHYYGALLLLKKWGSFHFDDIIEKLNKETFGSSTYNIRLTTFKGFFQWLQKRKAIPFNPLEDVKRKKVVKKPVPERQPFSSEEISRILEAFKNDTCNAVKTKCRHSFYFPFIAFIMRYGCRPGEAVGLRVQCIDFTNNTIEIKEVLARSIKGAQSKRRIRKETKNGVVRLLPLLPDMRDLLLPLCQGKDGDDLVFTSYKGLAIDDVNFLKRVFKPVLNKLNIKYRVLYACRHSFSSRCMDAGINPVNVAFLMGNSPVIALKAYTHQMSLPQDLPM